MLTRADYLAFEGLVVKSRIHLVFSFGETERVDRLDQAMGEKTKLFRGGKKSRTTVAQ